MAGRSRRRRDRMPDALADVDALACDQRRRGFRACLEIGDGHVVAVAEAMHIAGLQRVELGKAGIAEGAGDRVAVSCALTRPLGLAAARSGGSVEEGIDHWSAMRVRVTR